MADSETSCKVNYVGVWYEDTFTDDVMKTIAAYAHVEKGKKVKLTLNKDGVKVSRSKLFQQNLVEVYPYEQIKAVTKNPRLGNCIMFILDGQAKKYKIIVVKCPSDSNAIYLVNRASQFREHARVGNVELRKRDNGNWTLRDRSAHNANMHMREIFNEHPDKRVNGDTTKLNGDVNHVPVLDRSKQPVRTSTYIKRNGAVTRESVVVTSEDQPGVVHAAVRDEGIRDADDLKALMEHVKVADAANGSRRGSMLPSKPEVNTASSTSGPLILRATPKSYDARIVTANQQDPYYSRLAAHRRVSGDFILPAKLDRKYSSASVRGGSMRVQFDNESLSSVQQKTMSMRIRPVTATPANFSTSTTIQRSIENTYGRPVIIQQGRASGNAFVQGSRQQRPSSVHVMGANQLRVYKQGAGVYL